MARPRSFDPETALDAARDVFWARGYAGASYEQITEATGLNKPSLYAAFGDKQQLFAAVLDRYQQGLLAHARHILGKPGTARGVVGRWLEGFAPVCSGARGARGCLSVNTLVEGVGRETAIGASVDAYNCEIEGLLRARLEEGAAASEFPAGFDTAGAAHALVAGYNGLMVMARQAPPAALTRAAIARLLKVLEP
jgi:AcrR family transcriptional regulator